MDKHEDLQAMSEKQLLAEILLQLRQNTDAVEHLQDINADTYGLLKDTIWSGRW